MKPREGNYWQLKQNFLSEKYSIKYKEHVFFTENRVLFTCFCTQKNRITGLTRVFASTEPGVIEPRDVIGNLTSHCRVEQRAAQSLEQTAEVVISTGEINKIQYALATCIKWYYRYWMCPFIE